MFQLLGISSAENPLLQGLRPWTHTGGLPSSGPPMGYSPQMKISVDATALTYLNIIS